MKPIALKFVIAAAGLLTSSVWAAAPAGRYTIATDTVKDIKTGLTWQRAVPSWSFTLASAKAYCPGLNLGGFSSGWRLPTKKELETLVDRRTRSPCIDSTAFPNTPPDFFWSSTNFVGLNLGWGVYFNEGLSDDDAYALVNRRRVRCVR